MDTARALELYYTYASGMVYVDVEKPDGKRSIGSAFHIGDGIFVTARHVLEGNKIIEIKATEPVGITIEEMYPTLSREIIEKQKTLFQDQLGFELMYKYWTSPLVIERGPIYPEDENIDLAIFKVSNVHHAVARVELGTHYDEFVYRRPWVMSEVVVMGYPPIPLTNEPLLIGAKAHIHAYTYIRHSPKIHFILSATPRGGFSGGLALHEGGFALGVITSGLFEGNQMSDLGFMAVLSVESILVLLEENSMPYDREKR